MKLKAEDMKTIYRVVGGHANRSQLEAYEIIPYLCYRETPRYYFTRKDGQEQMHQKRITSNSRWFVDPIDAAQHLKEKLNEEYLLMQESFRKFLEQVEAAKGLHGQLYFAEFKRGLFTFNHWYIEQYNERAWRVEKEGKRYYYWHESNLHNPERPFERWINPDLDWVHRMVKQYYVDRITYIQKIATNLKAFVKGGQKVRERGVYL